MSYTATAPAYSRDRYLQVVRWAERRYSVNAGRVLLVTHIGVNPTAYTRIERAAWNRYIWGGAS